MVPYFLAATAGYLPVGVADWLLRVTPAAAFALQQADAAVLPGAAYYAPVSGFYPLAPWAGFAVLCGWTALAVIGWRPTCCAGGTREPEPPAVATDPARPFADALHAEWTKLRTLPAPAGCCPPPPRSRSR